MKIKVNKNVLAVTIGLVVCMLLLAFPTLAQDDISSSRIKSTFSDTWNDWKDILRIITTIIVAVGGLGLAYAYSTNKQESKDHLVKWIIALVVIAFLRLTVLA